MLFSGVLSAIGTLWPLLLLAGLLAALGAFLKKGKWAVHERGTLPYMKVDSLFTPAEKRFYQVLKEVVPPQYVLFAKVRLLDLFDFPKIMNGSDYHHYKNKVQSKHIDFLICDREKVAPLLVLELNDSSHLRPDREKRDQMVSAALNNAKLPLLYITAASAYD